MSPAKPLTGGARLGPPRPRGAGPRPPPVGPPAPVGPVGPVGPGRCAVGAGSRLEDDGHPGTAATRHADDVPAPQDLQRTGRLGAPGHGAAPGQVTLEAGQFAAERGVLHEVAPVAGHLPGQLGDGFPVPADLPGQVQHAPVRLELGERRFQQRRGPVPADLPGQVDGHVVGRPEAGVQRVGPGAGQAADGLGVDPGLPQHHGVPLDVDAAPPGPPGQLGVLPRGQLSVRLAVPLVQFLDDDGPGRHVDAQGQRLGREHHADQAGREQLLDHLLKGGEHPGVVGGDAPLQAGEPFAVAEHGEVLVRDVRGPPLHELGDRGHLIGLGEPQPGGQALLHGRVAAGPAEDELDSRQQPGPVEPGDDLGPVRRPAPAGARRGRAAAAAARAAPRVTAPAAARRTAAAGRRDLRLGPPIPLRHPHQLGVHAGAGRIGEQVIQPAPGHHVLPQRDRPVLVHDDGDAAAQVVQPVAELLGVADRGRQGHQPHRLRQMDDDLLPHGAAGPVGQVVHLVQDHVTEALEGGRSGVEHVPEHLGGHHHDGRLAVDAVIASEQPDGTAVVAADQVGVLLVGQRLDRGGVEALEPAFQGQVHGELPDHGLARAGRRGDQDPVAGVQRGARPDLEVVEFEAVQRAEAGQLGVGLPVTELRVTFRGSPSVRSGGVVVSPVERRGHIDSVVPGGDPPAPRCASRPRGGTSPTHRRSPGHKGPARCADPGGDPPEPPNALRARAVVLRRQRCSPGLTARLAGR